MTKDEFPKKFEEELRELVIKHELTDRFTNLEQMKRYVYHSVLAELLRMKCLEEQANKIIWVKPNKWGGSNDHRI